MEVSQELSAWVRRNPCTYEIEPIVELRDGERVESGFELNLHVELPWAGKVTPELQAKSDEIKEKLHELLDAILPKDPKNARFEILPYHSAARFRRGAGRPQLSRTVQVFHTDFSAVQPDDRAKFGPFEDELVAIGFKKESAI